MRARRWNLWLLALPYLCGLDACSTDECLRHTDCPRTDICSFGSCVSKPTDDSGSTDAGAGPTDTSGGTKTTLGGNSSTDESSQAGAGGESTKSNTSKPSSNAGGDGGAGGH